MPWKPWEPLGGQIVGDPTVLARGPDQWDVFAEGLDQRLWQLPYRENNWLTWRHPDQEAFALGSSPVVASSGDDVQVFARGQDAQLWRKVWQDSGWQAWEPLGGTVVGKPAAAGNSNVFDVIVRGLDDKLHIRTWFSDHWTDWGLLDGGMIVAGSPVAVVNGDGIAVYVRATDGAVWTSSRDGAVWRPWTSLGGKPVGDPGVVRSDRAGAAVYIRDSENHLQTREQFTAGGPWLEWGVSPDTHLDSSPAAAGDFTSWANRQIYARGVDGQLWRKHEVHEDVKDSPAPRPDATPREYNDFFILHAVPDVGRALYEGKYPLIGTITGPILKITVPSAPGVRYSVAFGMPGTAPDGSWAVVDDGGALEGTRLAPFMNLGKTSVFVRAMSTLSKVPPDETLVLKITYVSTGEAATRSKLSALSSEIEAAGDAPRPMVRMPTLVVPETP